MASSPPPLRLAPPDPKDPQEQQDVHKFAHDVLKWSVNNSRFTGRYIQLSYNIVLGMYILLFLVGIGTAITAIIEGFLARNSTDTFSTLIFAGLSSASFFTLFISKPLESLERNTFFSSWIVAIMNNYWTRLAYLDETHIPTMSTDLQAAADALTTELSNLADKYAAVMAKYPTLVTSTSNGNTAPTNISTVSSNGNTANLIHEGQQAASDAQAK